MPDEIIITVESYFALLLLKIQDRIKTEVPEIKWVDQDMGQLEVYDIRPPVQFPCLLVDFATTNYDMLHSQVQFANSTVVLRLGFNPFSSANSAAPVKYKKQALEYYELEQKVYKAFQGWFVDDLCQPWTRVSSVTEGREDDLRIRTIQFTTTFKDHSATPEYTKAQPGMTINLTD